MVLPGLQLQHEPSRAKGPFSFALGSVFDEGKEKG
jgi:hypothetical protein